MLHLYTNTYLPEPTLYLTIYTFDSYIIASHSNSNIKKDVKQENGNLTIFVTIIYRGRQYPHDSAYKITLLLSIIKSHYHFMAQPLQSPLHPQYNPLTMGTA